MCYGLCNSAGCCCPYEIQYGEKNGECKLGGYGIPPDGACRDEEAKE